MLITSSMESSFSLLVEQLQLFSPPFQLSIQINFCNPSTNVSSTLQILPSSVLFCMNCGTKFINKWLYFFSLLLACFKKTFS